MSLSTMITIDSRSVEHLNIKSGFLSFLVGSILKLYGEKVAWSNYSPDQPFFVAIYLLDDLTWYCSKLVDPELIRNQEADDGIIYMNDEPYVSEKEFVISGTITSELVTEPNFTGYRTHVVLDSHFEDSNKLLSS